MIVVPRAQQQVQPRAIQGTSDELRRMDLSDAFGAVGADLLMKGSDVVEKMAEREDALLRQETELQMRTDLAAFDVENESRVQEIARQSPGRGLTKRVMDDFNERKQSIVDVQPNYLKAEAQAQLLPLQVRQAKSAIGVENQQIRQANELRSQTFRDSMINSVAFGRIGIDDAVRNVDEFVARLPADSRDVAKRQLTSSVYEAHLLNRLQADPAATVEEIKNGKYDDKVPARSLLNLYGQGQKAIAEAKTETNRLREDALKIRASDPLGSALKLWQSQGVPNPTEEQLMEIQRRPQEQGGLGLPTSYQTAKSQSDEFFLQITMMENAEEAAAFIQNTADALTKEGKDPARFLQESLELSDASPLVKLAATMDMQNTSAEFQSAWFAAVKDPQTVSAANRDLQRRFDQGEREDILAPAYERANEIAMLLEATNVSPTEVLDQQQAIIDVATVAASTYSQGIEEGSGWFGGSAKRQVVNSLKQDMETYSSKQSFIDGPDRYVLPKAIAASVPVTMMRDAKRAIIEAELFSPISTYIDMQGQKEDLLENAGWTMGGNDSLVLSLNGQAIPSKDTGGPFEITFDDLASLIAGDKLNRDQIITRAIIRSDPVVMEALRSNPFAIENWSPNQ